MLLLTPPRLCAILVLRKAVVHLEKQTKNIITREWVEKELRFYNTADIRYFSVLVIIMAVFFVPLTVGSVVYLCSWCESMLINILFAVFVGAVFSSPVLALLFMLILRLNERKLLNRGDFEITKSWVLYKSERTRSRHSEMLLHFPRFKEAVVDAISYELAEPGDEYYIVHYKSQKTIRFFYPTKRYEYKEL